MDNPAMIKSQPPRDLIKRFSLYIGFIIICVAFTILSPYFMTKSNILNIIVQSSIIAIIATGQTMVIVTGGIDLSVGSIVAFVGVFTGLLLTAGMAIPLAVIISIVLGILIGLINGAAISYGRVPPFIMTLGMMGIAAGGALALNNGQPIAGFPAGFQTIATASVASIPSFVFYTIIIYAVMYVVMERTKFGRYIYAIGGNRSAARLSGVKVKFIEMLTYAFSGLFSGIGAVLLTARLNYATPTAGSGYELDAIAAVVIGGTSLAGGEGKVVNTLVGALILGTLRNGLTILNVSSYYQRIIIGIVIIAAVFADKIKDRSNN